LGINTGEHGPPDDLEPIGRFQWEQSLRMLALPWPTKSFGLLLATYADKNGTNIHPGEEHLARVTGLTQRSVRTHLAALRETYYLIERTERGSAGGRRSIADDYRLVLPNDSITRIGLVPHEEATRPPETLTGQQDKLPIEAVDNQENTGSSFPVDNPDHRKLISGDRKRTPEAHFRITGNSATDHRKSNDRSPEAGFRSPLRTPKQDQNPDQASLTALPQLQGSRPPVDNPAVDNSWAALNAKVRDSIAAANARHARPTPPPIVRPNRE
jgi:DNA-binding transcriptional ArsR family regulator